MTVALATGFLAACMAGNGAERPEFAAGTVARDTPAGGVARPVAQPDARELVVRMLDVGQGEAIYVTNGASRVLIDGGPDPARLGRLLDSLGIHDTTIDVVILSHEHYDHHSGLRELFRSSRRIAVRYFFENFNPSPNASLRRLRDSVYARAGRGTLVVRDSDDPCGDGRAVCTITMRGGAKLHVMRPFPRGKSANDRSTPVKIVGPDSASFTMWLAGDAEHEAIHWFRRAGYDSLPGMKVHVLKADHHGSCNGVSRWYLEATAPERVAFSLGARNGYGHVHEQTKALYSRRGIPWHRTDRNGTITFRSPGTRGGGYSVEVQRGGTMESGASDRNSAQEDCNPMP